MHGKPDLANPRLKKLFDSARRLAILKRRKERLAKALDNWPRLKLPAKITPGRCGP
jgi:hypothetical protein